MLVETEAIILRTYKLAEADKIVVALTRRAGVVRGVARGARRLRSRFGAGLEPPVVVDFAYFEKEGQELVSVKRAEVIRSYFDLARHRAAWEAAMYMSLLVGELIPANHPDERVFRLLRSCLDALSEVPGRWERVRRYFEIWLLRLSGLWPGMARCVRCGREWGMSEDTVWDKGELVCLRCGTGMRVQPTVRRAVGAALALGPLEFAECEVPVGVGRLTESLITAYLEKRPDR